MWNFYVLVKGGPPSILPSGSTGSILKIFYLVKLKKVSTFLSTIRLSFLKKNKWPVMSTFYDVCTRIVFSQEESTYTEFSPKDGSKEVEPV